MTKKEYKFIVKTSIVTYLIMLGLLLALGK